ncbi:MAG TPA: DUF559 domain-containing protein [Actinomycetota bacterium]|nr:DUF559 domain-containing protein [Actinomycetota bacterium]
MRADLVGNTTTVGCIPVTNAGRSIVDVAGSCRLADLEAAVEDAIRRGLTSRKHLVWLMDGRRGKAAKGFRNLRRLLNDGSDARTESVLETRLLQAIRAAHLPIPEAQYEIADGDGFVARVDFAYPWAKVAIEADSYRFHSGREAWESDMERRAGITSLGWLVIHVTHRQMTRDMPGVARKIQMALAPTLPSVGRRE